MLKIVLSQNLFSLFSGFRKFIEGMRQCNSTDIWCQLQPQHLHSRLGNTDTALAVTATVIKCLPLNLLLCDHIRYFWLITNTVATYKRVVRWLQKSRDISDIFGCFHTYQKNPQKIQVLIYLELSEKDLAKCNSDHLDNFTCTAELKHHQNYNFQFWVWIKYVLSSSVLSIIKGQFIDVFSAGLFLNCL